MDETTRKRAFVAAMLAIGAAAALLLAFGSPVSGDEQRAAWEPGRRVIAPPAPPAPPAERRGSDHVHALGREGRRELHEARALAGRFAVAYLARDSGRMGGTERRALRATTTSALWARLREPVRTTPAWRPSRATHEEVSGVSETPGKETVEATIAYRRDGRRRFLSVVLARREERWLVVRVRL